MGFEDIPVLMGCNPGSNEYPKIGDPNVTWGLGIGDTRSGEENNHLLVIG
jgi:hypothetical protein